MQQEKIKTCPTCGTDNSIYTQVCKECGRKLSGLVLNKREEMTKRTMHSVKLFYSYAHKDLVLKDELAKHLGNARISAWYDRDIYPGTNWEDEIDDNLEQADIVLLLISPDFKASNYFSGKEMKRILEREKEKSAHVIPVLIRPVFWPDAPYRHLQLSPTSAQAVSTWVNKDEAFVEVAKDVYRSVDHVLKQKYIKDAEASMASGQYEDAYKAYKQAFYYASEDGALLREMGDLLVILGRLEEALQVYEEAIKLQSENDRLYRKKGEVLTLLGRHQDALVAYQQAVKLKKDDFALYKVMGDTFYCLNDLNKALDAYKEALSLQSNDYQLYMIMGKILFDLDNYQEALKAYETAERFAENDVQIFLDKGKILVALKRYTDALSAYNCAIELNPEDPAPYADKGYVFDEIGDYADALMAYEDAIYLDAGNAQLWRDKGDVLVKLARLEEAHAAYQEAISRAPDNAFFYKDSADTLFKLERYEEARAAYDEAIRRNPDIGSWYIYRSEVTKKIADKILNNYQELIESMKKDMLFAEKRKNVRDVRNLK